MNPKTEEQYKEKQRRRVARQNKKRVVEEPSDINTGSGVTAGVPKTHVPKMRKGRRIDSPHSMLFDTLAALKGVYKRGRETK